MDEIIQIVRDMIAEEGRGERSAIYGPAQIDHGHLSGLLSGKRRIGEEVVRKLTRAFPKRKDALFGAYERYREATVAKKPPPPAPTRTYEHALMRFRAIADRLSARHRGCSAARPPVAGDLRGGTGPSTRG